MLDTPAGGQEWQESPHPQYHRAQHLQDTGLYSTGTRNLEENPPCNAENNLRAGLIVIEAWFGGY